MARSLGAGERFRIEAMVGLGLSVAEVARRLGRSRSTVCREIARNGGRPGYRAEAAQQAAVVGTRRPRESKLARDAGLSSAVAAGLAQRWSPHAIAESLRYAGFGVCAETIYRACYDRSDLADDSWKLLPRQRRKRKPKSRCERAKRSALGDYRPLAERPVEVEDRAEAGRGGGGGGRSDHRPQQPDGPRHPGGANQPPHPVVGVARRLRLQKHRPSRHRGSQPPTGGNGQDLDLGPGTGDGPMGRHRKYPRHRGLLLRGSLPLATRHQRTNWSCPGLVDI